MTNVARSLTRAAVSGDSPEFPELGIAVGEEDGSTFCHFWQNRMGSDAVPLRKRADVVLTW